MSTAEWKQYIDYPETDGQPMGESDLHIAWTFRLRDILKRRYRDQNVYVGADLFIYYAEGYPSRNVAPDSFVVLDCEPRMRRVFKVWEEQRVPNVVFEITSRSTSQNDLVTKMKTYEDLGVVEYFLYDPEAEYLQPALQGYRLVGGIYAPIESVGGKLSCRELRVELSLDGNDLVLIDADSGSVCLTGEEAECELKERERKLRAQERESKEQERAARLQAEAELKLLREEVARLKAERG